MNTYDIKEDGKMEKRVNITSGSEKCCNPFSYNPKIKVAKLVENAVVPTRKHETDAGMDFYSLEDVVIPAFETKVLRTGITMEIPVGFVAQAWPKSRSDFNVGAGIIDEAYQKEIFIKIQNHMNKDINIKAGDGIAQIVLVPVYRPLVEEVSMLDMHKDREARKNDGIVNQV